MRFDLSDDESTALQHIFQGAGAVTTLLIVRLLWPEMMVFWNWVHHSEWKISFLQLNLRDRNCVC